MNEPVSNTPELSVTELAGSLKRTVEDAFGHVRLRGEISGYRGPHASGHAYFSIKDEGARIDAVIWKGVFSRMRFRPEEGMEVVATGRITTYPGKSTYQIVVEQLEPAGIGALMALLEERRRKLTAEGLFDEARKQGLPFLPAVIGIVTSPTGAVIRDMIHRLSDRFPRTVLLWPVRVQGEGAAEEVATAIDGFAAIGPDDELPRPDVLIVARGGGSLEDLWSFNEEIVVRAAARCPIPLISAIGHETDWTLLDLVADRRAPTPTAAAEMVVPVRQDLLLALRDRGGRLATTMLRQNERRRRDISALMRAWPSGDRLLAGARQRLDLAITRRQNFAENVVSRRRLPLLQWARRLSAQRPEARLARVSERLASLTARLPGLATQRLRLTREQLVRQGERLMRALSNRFRLAKQEQRQRRDQLAGLSRRFQQALAVQAARRNARLDASSQLLTALGYKQVLGRGFAVIRNPAQQPLRNKAEAATEPTLIIEFADGRLEVTTGSERPESPKPTAPRKRTSGGQGSLF
jgi:exodeoxyribonuclease VII large subunit